MRSRLHLRAIFGLVAALVLAAGVVVALAADDDGTTLCTADGLVGPNGEVYGRDHDQGCKFVDEDGRVVPGQ